MRAERAPIKLGNFSLVNRNGQQSVQAHTTHRQFNVTPLQAQYLEKLKTGVTVEQLVIDFLKQGWLVRFGELYDLMIHLQNEKLLLTPLWQELLSTKEHGPHSEKITASQVKVEAKDLAQLPFFHGLKPELLGIFARHAVRYECPAHTRICIQGQSTRDLFAMTSGEASIFRRESETQSRLLAKMIAPAVFGEGGFLLGRPRSADVITTSDCQFIRIQHLPEFEQIIKAEEASQLHRRFWVLHAMSTSPLFQKLPLEAWDDLAMLGEFKKFKSDDLLFNEGTTGASFYIIVQGRVSVWQKGQRINMLEQGSCLGEVALFASHGVRTASVKADLDSLLIEISPHHFYPLLARQLLLAKELEQLAYQRLVADRARARNA